MLENLKISQLCYGTWVFSGKTWGGTNEAHAIDALQHAVDEGITFIDTAPIYGHGLSEEIVGKALQGRRDQVFLATKCGLRVEGSTVLHDLSRQTILREVDESLRRLRTDYIDLYQCHWPDEKTDIAETMGVMTELQKQGKIRHIGLSNYSVELLEKALDCGDIVTSQNQYSLLNRQVEDGLLNFLKSKAIGFLAYGPLAGGILTGKYKTPPSFSEADARSFFYHHYQGDAFERVNVFLEKLRQLNRPLNQVALNWVRQQDGVASVLVGCRNKKQVSANLDALRWDLSPEELEMVSGWVGELLMVGGQHG